MGNVEELLRDIKLLEEDYSSLHMLQRLIGSRGATGKQIYDANVVALAHQASSIATDNARHFERFSPLISIEGLS